MKCFPLMFFVFFLMKVYIVFSVRQENQQFNLSMMENPNMNTIYKLLQQTQTQNSNIPPVTPVYSNNNNFNFDQFIKMYQLINAFNLNNNNFPSYQNTLNPNYMLFPQSNNVSNQPQIDTNMLLKSLMSQLPVNQQNIVPSIVNQQEPVVQRSKNNLRKNEEPQKILKENTKSEDNIISDKLKDDIKKLQELTKEANKIMRNKVVKKEDNYQDVFNSPEFIMKNRVNNGPVKDNNSEVNENIKHLQESIKVLPETNVDNSNIVNNEISIPSMNTITNSFENLSELKSQMKIDEEEHRKEEFEDRLNYLLSKLDVISKISDK